MKIEMFNDNFENAKVYQLPKAQLILADIPYNIGKDAYASHRSWWNDGEVKNGKSKNAGKLFFDTDENFNISNYFKFCTRYLKEDGCMILFCSFEQLFEIINIAIENGFKKYIPLVFIKHYSPQVLKSNMRIIGATEYGLCLYKEKLPKFRNKDENGKGHMIFNWFEYKKDLKSPRIHPTQKPVDLIERLVKIFTDEGDVVLDPVAGSGSTLVACKNINRTCYGFEIKKEFYNKAREWIWNKK